jgi:eukaryotic-like serine/threonine-protein kinase
VAVSSSPDPGGSPQPESFRLLRELGARVVPTWAAHDLRAEAGKQLVVVERIERGGPYSDQEIADWVRDARRMATLEHPNVGRLRDVVIRSEDVLVVADFVDGVRWSELSSAADRPSLEVALRVLIDALSGLSALHNLRDAKREPLKLFHAELTPECIIVSADGVARIVSACRVKSARARPGRGGSAYLAPEILLEDDSADARADVYSAGVMLWEALSGRPLFPNTQPSAIVTHLLSGRVAKATVPEGLPWAAPLADVATRALSVDPGRRFPSAAALAAELRRIAGVKLPPPVRVAGLVRATFGDGIRKRREALERGEVEESTGHEIPVMLESDRPSSLPTPVPPSIEPIEGPPPLPLRSRLPTLQGVAPEALVETDVSGPGNPVVVPSSSRPPPPGPAIAPPTPMVAFEIPSAARIPIDMSPPPAPVPPPLPAAVAPAFAPAPPPPAAAPLPFAPPPPPLPAAALPPPMPVPLEMPPLAPPLAPMRIPRSDEPVALARLGPGRGRRIAFVALPVLLLLAVLVWGLALRARSGGVVATEPTPSGAPTVTSAAAPPTATATETSTAAATVAPATATIATTLPASTAAPPTAEPTAPAPAPSVSASAAPRPAWMTAPWPAAVPPPPPPKRKYEPEGI